MHAVAALAISGQVVATQARWSEDGARILTEATVQTADGTRVTVLQPGGELDGLGQISFPGPVLLRAGMFVDLDAHDAVAPSGDHALVLDAAALQPIAGSGAFVREGTDPAPGSLFWASGCIFMTYDAAGTKELAGDTEFPLMDAAIANWNTSIAGCSYEILKVTGKESGHEVGKDYINLIKFREDKWCIPAQGSVPEFCHPAAAAGITTITYVKHPGHSDHGQIVDADVEINGVNFAISDAGQTTGSASCKAELANTFTHELGHVLGLQHTCTSPGDPSGNEPPRFDNNGAPVPACTNTSDPRIVDATMYPYQSCDETKKESLSDDDIQGACAIYPTASNPGTCEIAQPPTGCCDAGGAGAPTGALGAIGALFFLRRRRRS